MLKILDKFHTIVEVLTDLNTRGYLAGFAVLTKKVCMIYFRYNISLSPDEFQIDEIYRFEGNSESTSEMILYAISSKNGKVKGILINGNGIYGDSLYSEIVRRL
ncbi:MAG: phosphoribosylpyrophosphate synthetase [Cytophagales bacterium]